MLIIKMVSNAIVIFKVATADHAKILCYIGVSGASPYNQSLLSLRPFHPITLLRSLTPAIVHNVSLALCTCAVCLFHTLSSVPHGSACFCGSGSGPKKERKSRRCALQAISFLLFKLQESGLGSQDILSEKP